MRTRRSYRLKKQLIKTRQESPPVSISSAVEELSMNSAMNNRFMTDIPIKEEDGKKFKACNKLNIEY